MLHGGGQRNWILSTEPQLPVSPNGLSRLQRQRQMRPEGLGPLEYQGQVPTAALFRGQWEGAVSPICPSWLSLHILMKTAKGPVSEDPWPGSQWH